VSGATGMAGVFLDTAWHRTVGRDSPLLWPHLFIYGGGLGILLASAGCALVASRGGEREFGGSILRVGRVRYPFGFALAGLGVLTVIASAPVDVTWHLLFGKDVLIWSFPHLMAHAGAGLAAIGLLFAVAAQAGRGLFRRRWVWRAAMLAVFVDLVHRGLFVLAHYTMIPETRPPDFYPYLASLLLPLTLVAASRALGAWAPVALGLLFLLLMAAVNAMLSALDLDRYTLTPLVVLPALGVTLLGRAAGRRRDRARVALAAGAVFALVFTGLETLWMARVVGRPWMLEQVVAALPRSVVAGALSGYVGWVLGGFLRAVATPAGAPEIFGGARRARLAALGALALAVLGLVSTYHPQQFGLPMTVGEFALVPLDSFRYQEAIFWDVLLQPEWWRSRRVEARSEGIIEGFPVPIGPAWCARGEPELAADMPQVRFSLSINGAPVDLSSYPIVRIRHRDGAYCAWVGVASRFQRASENRFVYTVERPPDVRAVVDMQVVLKDP